MRYITFVLTRTLAWLDSRRGFLTSVLALAVFSAALRALWITYPAERIFDEVYSPKFAWSILHGEPFFDVHPLLTQLPQAVGLLLFGDTPLGWRFSSWLWGTLFIAGMGVLGSAMSGRRLVGVAAAVLATFDTAYFVYGRTGLPDMFLLMTFAWAFACFFLSARVKSRPAAVALAIASGVLFGNLVATKWFGIGGVVMAWLWIALALFQRVIRLRAIVKTSDSVPLPNIPGALYPVMFLLVPVVTYLLWMVPLVGIPGQTKTLLGEDLFTNTCTFGRTPNPAARPPTTWLGRVRHWHCVVWNYHAYLDANHPYGCRWQMPPEAATQENAHYCKLLTWPLNRQPVLFYLNTALTPARKISTAGNPTIWLLGFASVWGTLVSIFIPSYTRRWWPKQTQSQAEETLGDIWLVIGVLAFWLPWMLISRVTFHYHYFVSFTFSVLLLARWLTRLTDVRRLRPLVVVFFLCVALFFILLYPDATALRPWPLPERWRSFFG